MQQAQQTIAVIGGGVSGALTAHQLIRKQVQARVVLIEPRPEAGLGLAYSTPSLRHLLNVPAAKMSALPDEPDHFLHWLQTHHDAQATAETFAPRAVFGRYLQSLLAATAGLEVIRAAVTGLRLSGPGALLTLTDGSELQANRVVLATGNFDPAPLPGISSAAEAAGVYRHNAWHPAALEGLDNDAPVTLVGSGLTAVDMLLRLRELGHTGIVTVVSRHGVLPERHAAHTPLEEPAIPAGTPATCLAYLRALRAALADGVDWRAAVDSLRSTTNDLWLALPRHEQKRFRRHLQRRWEVRRHRMAPAIAETLDAELQAGTLLIRAGKLQTVEAVNGFALVTILRSGSPEPEVLTSRRVINCTGPGMDYRRVDSPLLPSLFAQGLAVSGPLGGGLHCSREGALLDAQGTPSGVLFNLGPGRQGTLLESIAVPEIRQQAADLAELLAERVSSTRRSRG